MIYILHSTVESLKYGKSDCSLILPFNFFSIYCSYWQFIWNFYDNWIDRPSCVWSSAWNSVFLQRHQDWKYGVDTNWLSRRDNMSSSWVVWVMVESCTLLSSTQPVIFHRFCLWLINAYQQPAYCVPATVDIVLLPLCIYPHEFRVGTTQIYILWNKHFND